MVYTDSQGMLVVSSTVASRYYNCCTDGQHQPRKLWIPLVHPYSSLFAGNEVQNSIINIQFHSCAVISKIIFLQQINFPKFYSFKDIHCQALRRRPFECMSQPYLLALLEESFGRINNAFVD
jgi:hypothetical protein